ncbi:MAG: hypothetical protein HOW73_34140 [Polyangiaceae bacterium]|nr:hypothetical protein [Polyangiaceae bacterium]
METRQLEDGCRLYIDGTSELHARELGRGVLVHSSLGPAPGVFAKVVIDDGERMLKTFGRCVFMVDAFESKRMSTEFREQMTKWLTANRDRVRVHILLDSKLMEMAINVANLVIGTVTARAYSDVAAWEKAGASEHPGFRRRAIAWSATNPR